MKSEDVHAGHRERVRQRFCTEGASGFQDHELLELLLYYAVPRGNVNPLAHRILNEFGTLSMLLHAQPKDIVTRCGIKESTAILLCLELEFAKRLEQEKWKKPPKMNKPSVVGAYALDLLSHFEYERFYIMCLNNKKELIHTCLISEGTTMQSIVHPRLVIEAAIQYKASSVIFLHNHPGGLAIPSSADIDLTNRLHFILGELEISVVDHIIVAGKEYFSFVQKDLLPTHKKNV